MENEHWKNLSIEDIKGEVWRDVVGYEGIYKVSNFGRIKTLRRNVYAQTGELHFVQKEKIISQSLNDAGYPRVSLTLTYKHRTKRVHRLVAIAFLGTYPHLREVNHKDGNTSNNMIDNLEWCTRSENMKHSYKYLNRPNPSTGKFGSLHHRSKQIVQMDLNKNKINEFGSILEAERNGFDSRCLTRALKDINATSQGFRWMYKKEYEEMLAGNTINTPLIIP